MRTLILLFLCVTAALAVDAKAPELTEVQKLRLQVDQKDAIIAQNNLQAAQQNFQNAVNKFTSDCEAAKKDDHFPESAKCDIANATITPAPEPVKAPEPKAEAPKK
jgi:hypothetical protein